MPMQARPRVLVVTTGGTITMQPDEARGLAPADEPMAFLDQVPELAQLADLDVIQVANVDSANIQPGLWLDIARAIYDRYGSYDGFVVTHGTDTMVYTAAALSFFLQELGKPIVLTGAQVPLGQIGSDGRANLVDAVRAATSELGEVAIVFGSLIIRGTRAFKASAFDLEAFRTVDEVPIGTIGLTLRLAAHARRRTPRRRPLFAPHLRLEVAHIAVWPGMRPEILEHLAATHAGLVIKGYGVGTLPADEHGSLLPTIRAATARGVAVVVSTQCTVGSTAMELYQVGRNALEAGAIPAMDMTIETAHVKLMWALGQTGDMRTIESLMLKDHVGEIQLTMG